MKEAYVRVIQPYMGGSFGSRLNPYIEILTALMCQAYRPLLLYPKRSVLLCSFQLALHYQGQAGR